MTCSRSVSAASISASMVSPESRSLFSAAGPEPVRVTTYRRFPGRRAVHSPRRSSAETTATAVPARPPHGVQRREHTELVRRQLIRASAAETRRPAWRAGRPNPAAAKRLWELSAELSGLSVGEDW